MVVIECNLHWFVVAVYYIGFVVAGGQPQLVDQGSQRRVVDQPLLPEQVAPQQL
jgi:hypothetical protein